MPSKKITLVPTTYGVSLQKNLASTVTKIEIDHYARLVDRKIVSIMFIDFEGTSHIPVMILDDGTQVAVMEDAAGNGPGYLEIA